ncbi:MAG TPA: hypothetical protein VEF04_09335, partial [Blastocatellia bacterium]|nr:hypothetical protein [Blastocatellia bacterium]
IVNLAGAKSCARRVMPGVSPLLLKTKVKYMRQILSISLIFCLTVISLSAQAKIPNELTDKQWQELFAALDAEDWNAAFDLSDKYLKLLRDNDEAESIANLRYMYLYSAAGKVSVGSMSYEDLEKKVNPFVGKRIVFPFRRIATKCRGAFNYICASDDAKNKAVTAAANKRATSIFAFEYVQLKEDFNFEKHQGEAAAVGGVVKSIVPNPNKSTIVILRIYISDGYIMLAEQNGQRASK